MRAKTKKKHEMGRRSAIVVAAVLAMIVSVVGWAAAGTAGAQAPSCLPTSDRTIGPHGFPGLRIKRQALVSTDALEFARILFATREVPGLVGEADALNSEGFVSGTFQNYFGRTRKSSHGDRGIATTVQLGSPEQAQAHLNRVLARYSGKRFTVPAIPGSQVLRRTNLDRGVVSVGLFFTDGDYSYVIGSADLPRPWPGVPKQRRALRGTKQVTNAAINLYNRVHGAAVCP